MNQDMFVLMCRGDVEVCPLGIFSSLEKALEKTKTMGNGRELWVEKFKLDQPDFYEEDPTI